MVPLSCVPPYAWLTVEARFTSKPVNCVSARLVLRFCHVVPRSVERQMPPSPLTHRMLPDPGWVMMACVSEWMAVGTPPLAVQGAGQRMMSTKVAPPSVERRMLLLVVPAVSTAPAPPWYTLSLFPGSTHTGMS
jgi:hypothetical protein